MTNDPPRGSAEEAALRRAFIASERRREAHYRNLDRILAGMRADPGNQTAIIATLEDLPQKAADVMAELHEPPEGEPPEPAGQRQLGPEGIYQSPEEAIAAAGMWSPEFAVWHEQHAAPSARGLFS